MGDTAIEKLNEGGALPTTSETPVSISNFEALATKLKNAAESRRRKKTHKNIRKPRTVGFDPKTGEEKVVDTVDRPEYQRWLDDNFPGWSITTCNFATDKLANGLPIAFHCDVLIRIIDNGVVRFLPGTGTCTVSSKEVAYKEGGEWNTQKLQQKRNIALTNAVKVACGWGGAFFDLRVDEEARERGMTPPTDDHQKEFEKLMVLVPQEFQENLRLKWKTQNIDSAPLFLSKMRKKLEEPPEEPKPSPVTSTEQPTGAV